MRSVRSRGWWSLFKRLQVKVNIVWEQCLHYMENMHCISLSICIVASIMLRPYFNHAEIIFNLQKLQIFFKIFFFKSLWEYFIKDKTDHYSWYDHWYSKVYTSTEFFCLFVCFIPSSIEECGSLRLTRFQAAIEASKWQSNCKHLKATAVVILCYINKTQLDWSCAKRTQNGKDVL